MIIDKGLVLSIGGLVISAIGTVMKELQRSTEQEKLAIRIAELVKKGL